MKETYTCIRKYCDHNLMHRLCNAVAKLEFVAEAEKKVQELIPRNGS